MYALGRTETNCMLFTGCREGHNEARSKGGTATPCRISQGALVTPGTGVNANSSNPFERVGGVRVTSPFTSPSGRRGAVARVFAKFIVMVIGAFGTLLAALLRINIEELASNASRARGSRRAVSPTPPSLLRHLLLLHFIRSKATMSHPAIRPVAISVREIPASGAFAICLARGGGAGCR